MYYAAEACVVRMAITNALEEKTLTLFTHSEKTILVEAYNVETNHKVSSVFVGSRMGGLVGESCCVSTVTSGTQPVVAHG